MSRATIIRVAFGILAIVFFATPMAARFVGITAESFENRPFAEAPRVSQGWDAFGQTTRFLTDRMPLRAQAVRANTRIWTDLFGTVPRYGPVQAPGADPAIPFAGNAVEGAPPDGAAASRRADAEQVLVGSDGWLFLKGEQDRACQPFTPFAAALDRWRGLVRQIAAIGPRVAFVVPPDKGSVYPEHLSDFPGEACAAAGKRRLWKLLEEAERNSPVIALRDDLMEQKQSVGDDLYSRQDSHWTTLGSLTLVRRVVERLGRDGPGGQSGVAVRPGELVDPGRVEYKGDLAALLGAPETDTHAQRQVVRDDAAPRIPGRTVLVGDSYSDAPVPQLMPYFENLQVLSWVNTPMPQIARQIRHADTVVLETVEREFTYRAAELVPPLRALLRDPG